MSRVAGQCHVGRACFIRCELYGADAANMTAVWRIWYYPALTLLIWF